MMINNLILNQAQMFLNIKINGIILIHFISIKNRMQIIIIKNEEILKNEILNVLPLKDYKTIQKIGGDFVVVDSTFFNIINGDKFASFPGKIKPIVFADSAIQLGKPWEICTCKQSNKQFNKQRLCISYYINLYFKISALRLVYITGWFNINEIIQTDKVMTFQFIKLTSNMQNTQFQNQNISPLLFYKLSQNLNKLIITTYSYTFPSVTLDFTNDPFLITKVFQVLNNIKLWHLIYVQSEGDELSVNIKFFENRYILVSFQAICKNLLLIILISQVGIYIFFNCNQDFQQENCHITCGECDGPTYQDCVSCSIESKRIYFQEYKYCIQLQNTIDYNDQCLGYPDFGFQLISGKEQYNGCMYGQFELNGL
ncbi:unnamed protein product [Paramecium octaurelia]|uniref:Transmembrane protein n=1 Tax=Paramecium octaurelia TaxID=43137 RepID=A0A8S1YKB5_PAROT|nr:unnamed protein product [Paramecium octaurelia]